MAQTTPPPSPRPSGMRPLRDTKGVLTADAYGHGKGRARQTAGFRDEHGKCVLAPIYGHEKSALTPGTGANSTEKACSRQNMGTEKVCPSFLCGSMYTGTEKACSRYFLSTLFPCPCFAVSTLFPCSFGLFRVSAHFSRAHKSARAHFFRAHTGKPALL